MCPRANGDLAKSTHWWLMYIIRCLVMGAAICFYGYFVVGPCGWPAAHCPVMAFFKSVSDVFWTQYKDMGENTQHFFPDSNWHFWNFLALFSRLEMVWTTMLICEENFSPPSLFLWTIFRGRTRDMVESAKNMVNSNIP